jgi:hypothetical protein
MKTTVAAPFRHLRKPALRKSELVYYYALDRKWMNTEQAGSFIKNAEEAGLLAREGEVYRPAFDYADVTIPIGFKPTSVIFEKQDPVSMIINRIAKANRREETDIVAEMNTLIREGFDNNLAPEAAIAIIARRYNVPFDDCIPALKQNLAKGN